MAANLKLSNKIWKKKILLFSNISKKLIITQFGKIGDKSYSNYILFNKFKIAGKRKNVTFLIVHVNTYKNSMFVRHQWFPYHVCDPSLTFVHIKYHYFLMSVNTHANITTLWRQVKILNHINILKSVLNVDHTKPDLLFHLMKFM